MQYTLFLYRYLKKWRKNPQWSFSCCLALLLRLSEIPDLIETDVLTNQLQAGQIDMPTIFITVNDSGFTGVTRGSDEQNDDDDDDEDDGDDDDAREIQNDNGQDVKYSNSKCHQGTQTGLSALSIANSLMKKSLEEKEKDLCE